MATIKITRPDEYRSRWRNYKILIDGQNAGALATDETKQFPISPGTHTITARIDWCGSPDLTLSISGDETKNLEVSGFTYSKWSGWVNFGIILLYFIVKFTLHVDYVTYLIAPAALFWVYFLTIGRNKFLRLRLV